MSRGKYLSLEEAREAGNVDRFAKENPSEGDRVLFSATLERMAKNQPLTPKTNKWGQNVDCNDTQTPQDS